MKWLVLYFFLLGSVAQGEEFTLKEVPVVTPKNSNPQRTQIVIDGARALSRQSLFDALGGTSGIETQVSCAFCGSKRVTINGHRGEHTTLLVDGLSLHSSVSSFYGIDSIPLSGIQSIDVYRGAGNTSVFPEGLAGVVNILTQTIDYDQSDLMTEFTQRGDYNLQFVNRSKINEQWGLLLGGQGSFKNYWDQDQNRIAELPLQRAEHVLLKLQFSPTTKQRFSVRVQRGQNQTRGAHLDAPRLNRFPAKIIDERDFESGDIRRPFLGSPEYLADQVGIEREELAFHYHGLSDDSLWEINFGSGWAKQQQAAIYSHGYDYNNQDFIHNSRLEVQYLGVDHWNLKFGGDYKLQNMNSNSEYLYDLLSLTPDNFKQEQWGLFSEVAYQGWENQEIKLSLRSQQISTDWLSSLDHRKDQVLVPKLQYSLSSEQLGQHYISFGAGYRSPLSLFESQHGTDHYGFLVQLSSIETSQHFGYGFSQQTADSTLSVNWHRSRIFNMAYGLDRARTNEPTLFINADEVFDLHVIDMEWGHKIFKQDELFFRADHFILPDSYVRKLPVAAIELRTQLEYSWNGKNDKWQSFINWQAGRNLTRYAGYGYHYNQVQEITDMQDERFPGVIAQSQKLQKSPDVITFDLMYSYFINENSTLYLGILNLLDTTQVSLGDSPLTWHVHGAHYHLDNFHIWGPLRGREFVVRLQSTF